MSPDPSLLKRLQERKLVQWAIAYLAGVWVVFEVTDAVGGRWNLPDVLFQSLTVVLAVGFFVCTAALSKMGPVEPPPARIGSRFSDQYARAMAVRLFPAPGR